MRSELGQARAVSDSTESPTSIALDRTGAAPQAEAIDWAKALNPSDGQILVERVRNTDRGHPDKWRRPEARHWESVVSHEAIAGRSSRDNASPIIRALNNLSLRVPAPLPPGHSVRLALTASTLGSTCI